MLARKRLWVDIGIARVYIIWLIMASPFIYFLLVGTCKTACQFWLSRRGGTAKALVLSAHYNGMRGMSRLYYNFRVNNEFYSGHTLNIDDYLVGDSIDVLYI